MLKNALALTLASALVVPATVAVTSTPAEARPRYYTTDNGIQYWRGNDGRYYCKKRGGTTGLLIGGAAGALVGRAIDSNGSRATGTIVGAAAGALLGREIERSRNKARCR